MTDTTQRQHKHVSRHKNLLTIVLAFVFLLPLCFSVVQATAVSASPSHQLADTINLNKKDLPNNISSRGGDEAVKRTLNGVYTIAAIIAVIIIIAAGISIIVADGDSQKVATARKAIIYACVGLVIVGSAFIITGIVQGIGTR